MRNKNLQKEMLPQTVTITNSLKNVKEGVQAQGVTLLEYPRQSGKLDLNGSHQHLAHADEVKLGNSLSFAIRAQALLGFK